MKKDATRSAVGFPTLRVPFILSAVGVMGKHIKIRLQWCWGRERERQRRAAGSAGIFHDKRANQTQTSGKRAKMGEQTMNQRTGDRGKRNPKTEEGSVLPTSNRETPIYYRRVLSMVSARKQGGIAQKKSFGA